MKPSGIRLGAPTITTRGLGDVETRQIGRLILDVVDGLAANGEDGNAAVKTAVRDKVAHLLKEFPLYG